MYFDIGANIGKWSLANMNKTDKIIAVEASSQTFNNLLENTRNTNIEALNYAVCNNNNEDVVFFEAEANTLSSLRNDWFERDTRFNDVKYQKTICKSITFDKLIELYGVPDYIKVDVECGEFECISSLSTKVKLLAFEFAAELNDITFKCIDYLHDTLGYTKFFMLIEDNYTFIPDNSLFVSIDIVKNMLNNTIPKKDWGMIYVSSD